MARGRNWSVDEVTQALALYLRLDFGKFHARNPQVMSLATRLGRTPGAVALKLTNLAALDESLPQRGMANASATDRRVWDEFISSPERVLASYAQQISEPGQRDGFAERQARFSARQSDTRQTQITPRIGHGFFREMILTSYRGRCALTGNDDPRLLTASHIVGWAQDAHHRVNPSNGICLNALHDRAFDRHLITFDEDFRMKIAPDVPEAARRELQRTQSERLQMPARFLPSQSLLERHRRAFHDRLRAA